MIRKERSDGIAVFVATVLRVKFTQDTKPRQQQVRRHHADEKEKPLLVVRFSWWRGVRREQTSRDS